MDQPNLQHQSYQDFPKLDAPMVDSQGRLTFAWYRLLIRMWNALGLATTPWLSTSFLQATSIATNPVIVYGVGPDGKPVEIGPVPIPGSPAADQIAFEALQEVLLPDPPVKIELDPGVLQFLTPSDASGTGGTSTGDLLICVTGDVPITFASTLDGLPVYVRGTL